MCALDYDLVDRPHLILNGGIREKENEGIIIFLKLFSLFRPSFLFNVCSHCRSIRRCSLNTRGLILKELIFEAKNMTQFHPLGLDHSAKCRLKPGALTI